MRNFSGCIVCNKPDSATPNRACFLAISCYNNGVVSLGDQRVWKEVTKELYYEKDCFVGCGLGEFVCRIGLGAVLLSNIAGIRIASDHVLFNAGLYAAANLLPNAGLYAADVLLLYADVLRIPFATGVRASEVLR